jgi:hypothetical protein
MTASLSNTNHRIFVVKTPNVFCELDTENVTVIHNDVRFQMVNLYVTSWRSSNHFIGVAN